MCRHAPLAVASLLLLLFSGAARADSGGRSTFRTAEPATIVGQGKAARIVIPLAYENPGASARQGKDANVARFFVHERPPYTINTGGGRDNALEVAAGKPIGEVVMSRETGMCKLEGRIGELGLQRGKQYYLAAYWPGILGGDGNGHRWGVCNNPCGGNAPVCFTVPAASAEKNAAFRRAPAARIRWLGAGQRRFAW